MAQEDDGGPSGGLLSLAALPVFSVFFLWGFGTGALWMVRPLYAYSFGGSIFLVGLVSAFSAAPRMFGAPLAGALTDRIGRRPVVAAGAILHGGALAAQAYTTSYPPFLALELISGFGVAVWVTGSSVLLADFTRVANRGRGVALRNTSMRIGILAGPAAGGLVADLFDLASVFLFIAATKVVIVAIVILLIKETRSRFHNQVGPEPAPQQKTRLLPDLSVFRTKDFLALGMITLALGLVTQGPGAFRTFFPVQAAVAGLSLTDVGNLISASGLAAMLVALPVGALVDWSGRKPMLVVGLLVIGLSLFLVAGMNGLLVALAAAVAFGVGEAVGSNTVQTYAMDLAPEDRRGYFLGTWQATMNVGQLIGPLVVGALAVPLGIPVAFAVIGGVIIATGVATAFVGRETVA
jgi:MFS family permease